MPRSPLVLIYHGFGSRTAEQDPHNLFVPTACFAGQLDRLLGRGYQALDLDGYLAGLDVGRWPRRSFLVTIDDGYISVLEEAAPVLAAHGVPAVLFVPPARLGGTSSWMSGMPNEPLLDADGVRAVQQHGIEVGVHGLDHEDMVGMGPDALRRNTVEARDALAEVTGTLPRSFAYPSGVFDDAAVEAVRAAGYAVAFSLAADRGRLAVPRIDVNSTDTARTFALKTRPWWPHAQRLGRYAPGLRRAVHRLVGSAR